MSPETWIVIAAAVAAALVLPRLLQRRGSPGDVRALLARGATVVDVRSPAEFRSGAFPGALNIPVQEIGARASKIPRDRPVVLYCASGMRSAVAAGQLRKAGFAEVLNAGSLRDMPQ